MNTQRAVFSKSQTEIIITELLSANRSITTNLLRIVYFDIFRNFMFSDIYLLNFRIPSRVVYALPVTKNGYGNFRINNTEESINVYILINTSGKKFSTRKKWPFNSGDLPHLAFVSFYKPHLRGNDHFLHKH